jgi:hypothetical protein
MYYYLTLVIDEKIGIVDSYKKSKMKKSQIIENVGKVQFLNFDV